VVHNLHIKSKGICVFDGSEASTRSGTKCGLWSGKDEELGIEFTGHFSGNGIPIGSWRILHNEQEYLYHLNGEQVKSSITEALPVRIHTFLGQTRQELQAEYELKGVK